MGIREFDFCMMENTLRSQNLIIKGLKMLQLGDQIYKEKNKQMIAKEHFESLGCFVISIDIKGENGSLSMDLSKIISWPEYRNYFDIVTNFGTSEHVSDHMNCFKNMYCFCRKGGILCNLVPREGHWNDHSHQYAHKYTTEFFNTWAIENNCEIILNRVIKRKERGAGQGDNIFAVLKRI
jgi:hypothetical protein